MKHPLILSPRTPWAAIHIPVLMDAIIVVASYVPILLLPSSIKQKREDRGKSSYSCMVDGLVYLCVCTILSSQILKAYGERAACISCAFILHASVCVLYYCMASPVPRRGMSHTHMDTFLVSISDCKQAGIIAMHIWGTIVPMLSSATR